MSATCSHPDGEAALHPECAGCAAEAIYQSYEVPFSLRACPRCGSLRQRTVSPGAGESYVCPRCGPERRASPPSRPIADLRADYAELESVVAVLSDLLEWRGPAHAAEDPRFAELAAERDAVVYRLIGSTIAGRLPSGQGAEFMALLHGPRPGSWYGDEGADGRMLTQDETDVLVREELWALWWQQPSDIQRGEQAEMHAILGDRRGVRLVMANDASDLRWAWAYCQRGGIDSDPLVRLLAFRAWGDRDLRWFEERGVRVGDRVSFVRAVQIGERSPDCGVSWPGELWAGDAISDARPGELVDVRLTSDVNGVVKYRVSDRPRTPPPAQVQPIEQIRALYGFDELRIDYRHDRRTTVVTATVGDLRSPEGDRQSQVELSDHALEQAHDRSMFWWAVFDELADRLGLSRPETADYALTRELDPYAMSVARAQRLRTAPVRNVIRETAARTRPAR